MKQEGPNGQPLVCCDASRTESLYLHVYFMCLKLETIFPFS